MKLIAREHLLEYERDKYKRWYELALDESKRNNKLKKEMQEIRNHYLTRLCLILKKVLNAIQ